MREGVILSFEGVVFGWSSSRRGCVGEVQQSVPKVKELITSVKCSTCYGSLERKKPPSLQAKGVSLKIGSYHFTVTRCTLRSVALLTVTVYTPAASLLRSMVAMEEKVEVRTILPKASVTSTNNTSVRSLVIWN